MTAEIILTVTKSHLQ